MGPDADRAVVASIEAGPLGPRALEDGADPHPASARKRAAAMHMERGRDIIRFL